MTRSYPTSRRPVSTSDCTVRRTSASLGSSGPQSICTSSNYYHTTNCPNGWCAQRPERGCGTWQLFQPIVGVRKVILSTSIAAMRKMTTYDKGAAVMVALRRDIDRTRVTPPGARLDSRLRTVPYNCCRSEKKGPGVLLLAPTGHPACVATSPERSELRAISYSDGTRTPVIPFRGGNPVTGLLQQPNDFSRRGSPHSCSGTYNMKRLRSPLSGVFASKMTRVCAKT